MEQGRLLSTSLERRRLDPMSAGRTALQSPLFPSAPGSSPFSSYTEAEYIDIESMSASSHKFSFSLRSGHLAAERSSAKVPTEFTIPGSWADDPISEDDKSLQTLDELESGALSFHSPDTSIRDTPMPKSEEPITQTIPLASHGTGTCPPGCFSCIDLEFPTNSSPPSNPTVLNPDPPFISLLPLRCTHSGPCKLRLGACETQRRAIAQYEMKVTSVNLAAAAEAQKRENRLRLQTLREERIERNRRLEK
jgi:hypothetical protein